MLERDSSRKSSKLLNVFGIIINTFTLGTGRKTVNEIVQYRQQVEPTTGLTKQILLSRAIADLTSPEGRLWVNFKKMGFSPLASPFEEEVETNTGGRVIIGVNLNLEAQVKFNGDDFYVSKEDGFSVSEALITAVVALDSRDKKGQADLVLKRSENPEYITG